MAGKAWRSARGHVAAMVMIFAAAGIVLGACGGGSGTTAARSSDVASDEQSDTESSSKSSSKKTSSEPDACSLLSNDEVTGVFKDLITDDSGFAVTSEDSSLGDARECSYTWTSASVTGKDFQLSVFPEKNYVDAGAKRRDISGVGDEAWEEMDNWYAQVADLMVHLVNVQETDAVSDALLKIAAGHLG